MMYISSGEAFRYIRICNYIIFLLFPILLPLFFFINTGTSHNEMAHTGLICVGVS